MDICRVSSFVSVPLNGLHLFNCLTEHKVKYNIRNRAGKFKLPLPLRNQYILLSFDTTI
jgi:hypothetical protein